MMYLVIAFALMLPGLARSASIQEMVDGAANGGHIIVEPGVYELTEQLVIDTTNLKLEGYGVTLICQVDDDCIRLNSSGPELGWLYRYNVIEGFQIEPGPDASGHAAIVDNSSGTQIRNIIFWNTPDPTTGLNHDGRFNYLIKTLNNQGAVYEGIKSARSVLRCDEEFCGWAIYGAGPFSQTAAVGWLRNLDLTMQCEGNGVLWESGNSVHIEDSVIQAHSQFAVKVDNRGGGGGGLVADNVYIEGGCVNPVGNVGYADYMVSGPLVMYRTGGQVDRNIISFPLYLNNGPTQWNYYIVARAEMDGSPGDEYSTPLAAGYAKVDGQTPVPVEWNVIPGAVSYDVLRVAGSYPFQGDKPHGTQDVAVAEGLLASDACGAHTCTFLDPATPPASYTVRMHLWDTWFPRLVLWPGTVVLSAHLDSGGGQQSHVGTYVGTQREQSWDMAIISVQSQYRSQRINVRDMVTDASPVLSGRGSPENMIAAQPGTLYVDIEGGSGATLWVKESDEFGATGWVSK